MEAPRRDGAGGEMYMDWTRTLSRHSLAVIAACTLAAAGCSQPAQPSPTAAPKAAATSAPAATTAPAAKPAEAAKPAPKQAAAAATPAEDLNALYEAAKQEGEINWYTAINTDWGQPIVRKFEAKYPGVKINYNRQTSEKLEELLNAESKAGKMQWDVVDTNADAFLRFVRAGYVQKYQPSIAAEFAAERKDPNGMWTVNWIIPITVAVNTDRTKPEEYPKTWDDMTQPLWKGRFAVEEGNIVVFTAMKEAWGAEKATAFWKAIAANDPQIRMGNTLTAQQLAAGEFSATLNVYTHESNRLAGAGAPVKVIPLDPTILTISLVGLGAQAPHPNAAKLWINFLLGPEGQETIMEGGRAPARPDLFAKATQYLAGAKFFTVSPEVNLKVEGDRDQFREILGLK